MDITAGIIWDIVKMVMVGALVLGFNKLRNHHHISPLRSFWSCFLKDGGIISLPLHPSKRANFTTKTGTGYNDCLAAGRLLFFLSSMTKKNIKVEEACMEHLANNIIVIGGHLSNPGFNELTKGIMLEYHFEENKIVDTNGNELSFGEGYYSGLLIVGKNTYYPTNKKMAIIAGSHGPDTRHIAQAITKREYAKILNEEIRKRRESEVIEFVVKLKRIGETRPEEFIVSCKPCTLKR